MHLQQNDQQIPSNQPSIHQIDPTHLQLQQPQWHITHTHKYLESKLLHPKFLSMPNLHTLCNLNPNRNNNSKQGFF
jgi:hypothetical protein